MRRADLLRRLPAAVLVLLAVWLSLDPAAAPPHAHGMDKLVHVAAYGLLAAVLVPAGLPWRWAVPLAAGLGTVIEGLQALVPARSGSWEDAAAGALGAGLAWLAGGLFRWWRRSRATSLPVGEP